MKHYDLLVIGGGSGGVRAARLAAATGAKVLLAEQSKLGGTCVNVGCVPKKIFTYAAGYADDIACAEAFGRHYRGGELHWQTLRDNKDNEIARLNSVYKKLLAESKVCVVHARATICGKQTAMVGKEEIRADKILLAAGSVPIRPRLTGAELGVLSDDMFYLPQLPPRAIVIGGGYIAMEFAGILSGLGVDTTLCYRANLPLRGFDNDIQQHLADETQKRGINIQCGVAPEKITSHNNGLQLTLANQQTINSELILLATGRTPNIANIGIEHADITPNERGFLTVDDNYQTACPWLYAVGDIINTPALTPVAIAEAAVFVNRAFGDNTATAIDYHHIATAVFSRPSVATVGMTEAVATANGHNIAIYRSTFKAMKRGFAGKDWTTFIKMIVDTDNDRVLGVHLVGDDAGEIIQGIAIAVRMGATKKDFDATIGVHPTSAEELVTMR